MDMSRKGLHNSLIIRCREITQINIPFSFLNISKR